MTDSSFASWLASEHDSGMKRLASVTSETYVHTANASVISLVSRQLWPRSNRERGQNQFESARCSMRLRNFKINGGHLRTGMRFFRIVIPLKMAEF